jgi:hypothetical protein
MKRVIALTLFLFVTIAASSTFAQTPSFKVAWKQGIILGLLVPPNTKKAELMNLILKFRQAKKAKTLPALIPPVNLGLPDKYTAFMIFIFSDPKWATVEEYKKYESASTKSAEGRAISRAYINHIIASYEYDTDGKEYGSMGFDDYGDKSAHYEKLF